MEQESSDDASGKQPNENPPKSTSKKEDEVGEQEIETPTSSSDKRKLEVKEQEYITYVDASKLSVALSPTKRKCTEVHTGSSGKIEPGGKQSKVDETTRGTSAAGILQGSPKRSPRMHGTQLTPLQLQQLSNFNSSFRSMSSTTSPAGAVIQGSPKRSPAVRETSAADSVIQGSSKLSTTIPGTSVAGGVIQQSPKRSPTTLGTSVAGDVIQQSPKRSPTTLGTSVAGDVIKGSSKRSPTTSGTSVAGDVIKGSSKRSPAVLGTPKAGNVIQGSPKRSQVISGTSAADAVILGSPKRSPTQAGIPATGAVSQGSPIHSSVISGTSVAGTLIQGSPKASPTKRTYKERHQSCNADDLVEKRLKEESIYQSDSALDLRKDFKKQLPSSTQSPELDCLPTSSEKMGVIVEKKHEEKHQMQGSFPSDPKTASSEVTSSDGGEAEVSSTSSEGKTKSTGKVTSSVQGSQIQNAADVNKKETSPRTPPQHSGARPKEAAGRRRSEEYIEVIYPRNSPSKRFYGTPLVRRISPQRLAPSGSGSEGCFKVPPPPPPLEEQEIPPRESREWNALDNLFSLIEGCYAIVTAEQLRQQTRKEQEEKARRQREQAENFAKAKMLAKETTRRLREKEARLKESGSNPVAAPDEAVAGPSTSPDGPTGYRPKENVEEFADRQATSLDKEEHKSMKPVTESGNLPEAQQCTPDDNANIEGQSLMAGEEDDSKKFLSCAVQIEREEKRDDAKPTTSGVTAPGPQDAPNQEHLSLQQLVPHIDEISLNDSLENVAIADSDQEDDNIDLSDKLKS